MKKLLPTDHNSVKKEVSVPFARNQTARIKTLQLAERIEERMHECRLTRQQFASLMSVQPSIITRWLSGSHNFTTATLFEIEEKLSMSLINTSADRKSSSLKFHISVQTTVTTLNRMNELVGAFGAIRCHADRQFSIVKGDLNLEERDNDFSASSKYFLF